MHNYFKTFIAITLFLALFAFPISAQALTASQLQQQKDYYAAQAAAAKKKAEQKSQEAAYVKTQISSLSSQIDQTQSALTSTLAQAAATQAKIDELNIQIKEQENNLAIEKEKMGKVVSSIYMEGESGLLEAMIGSNNVSEIVDKQQYYDSIKQQVQNSMEKIDSMKAELSKQKDDQNIQLGTLTELKTNQTAQKKSLETNQIYKARLLTDTTNAIVDLKQQEKDAQAKIAQIQAQMNTLSGTKYWGTEIVSSGGGLAVPSFYQTGNDTRLGSSPYTVSLYGCLITSISMVASFYGHYITPTTFAQTASFNSGGYLIGYPSNLGVSISGSQSINWAAVNSELDSGHPVIVSIYIPSVGALNSDGSSHFIVIKGRSGSQYLMNDPVSGQRGYALGQVRSYKTIRP